ncbi:hypothetical protein D3C76_942300 [compost metagenome]
MPDSNRDAGGNPLFGGLVGAGVGAGIAYGAQRGIKAWDNRVQEGIQGRFDSRHAQTQMDLALGKLSPEQAAARVSRMEKAAKVAHEGTYAAKAAKGMEKVASKARHFKVPGGIIGGAAMLGGILGAASSD